MILKRPTQFLRHRISSLVLAFCASGLWVLPAQAEGSNELVSDGGSRPFVEWSTAVTAGIERKTLWRVYVRQGETVNLGSSVPNSYGGGTQDIVYRSPFGGQNGSCDVLNSGFGYINTPAKEAAGPLPSAGGYTPCSFVAQETGIYQVEFHGPGTAGNPPPTQISANRTTNTTLFSFQNTTGTSAVQNGSVGAWDITVRNSSGVVQTGRVFTYYVAINMGSNGVSLNSDFYIQTKDGFRYRTDMNGVDPFGFIFFANSRGYIDTLDGTISSDDPTLYRSAAGTSNDLNFDGNVRVQPPKTTDTRTDITHLTFINQPASATLNQLGIPLTAAFPSPPSDFKFVGGTGGSGNQTPTGVGGNFSFNSSVEVGSYGIIIDTNTDGVFDPSVDRFLQNVVNSGPNVVSWDGKDRNGNNLPPRPNNAPYDARIRIRGGEYHFPMLDAENNPSGFLLEMENAPGPFTAGTDRYTIYYNDENYTTRNGTAISLDGPGTPTNPRRAATGISSAGGEHEFSGNYGDFKGIDTWAYFPSTPVFTQAFITANSQANVRGRKSVRFLTDNDGSGTVTVGDQVEYTITYSNLAPGNSNAINFVVNDTLPPQLTFVSAAIAQQTSGNNITLNPNYTGSGAVTSLVQGTNASNSSTLRVGDTITITIKARVNNANSGNPIANQASAPFSTPENPNTSTGNALTDADAAGATANPPAPGSPFFQTADDGVNTGNNPASTADDDPTLMTVVSALPPNLRLVKRITAINGVDISGFVDYQNQSDPRAADDNAANWPQPRSTYLRGAIDGGAVKPGDTVEYTIYFLSDGGKETTNVQVCDLVPANTTFIGTAFNGSTPNQGLPGTDSGIALALNNSAVPTEPTVYLTNVADSDRGQFFSQGTPPAACAGSNNNGAVVVNVVTSPANLPKANAPGNPANSYGFIRFRVRVK